MFLGGEVPASFSPERRRSSCTFLTGVGYKNINIMNSRGSQEEKIPRKGRKGTWGKGFEKARSIVKALDDGNLEERNALVFQNLFFVGKGLAFDIPFLRVAVMHLDGFPGEIQTDVFEVLVDIFIDLLQEMLRVHFFLLFRGVFPNRNGREELFHMVVMTDGAVDQADRLLFIKRVPALKPAFEFMTVGADQVKSNHNGTILPPRIPAKKVLDKNL
jgi:hypothetical protein